MLNGAKQITLLVTPGLDNTEDGYGRGRVREINFRAQIDYIAINSRFRNALVKIKTYPGADCGSEYVPVVSEFKVKLKKQEMKIVTRKRTLNILKEDRAFQEQYAIEVKERFNALAQGSPNFFRSGPAN